MIRSFLLILSLSSATTAYALDGPYQLSDRPPTNCSPRLSKKMHLGQFFLSPQSPMVATQEKLFSNLVQHIYGSQPVFHKNAKDPGNMAGLTNFFARIRKATHNLPTTYRMQGVGDLGNINLNDRSLQFVLFLLLNGGSGDLAGFCRLKPISEYVTLKKRNTCIDLYLASKPILFAVFEDEKVVNDVMQYRQVVSERLRFCQTVETDIIEKDFRNQFEAKIISGIDPRAISFRVSDQYLPESK